MLARRIYVCGDIDHQAFKRFVRHLRALENEGADTIHVILCSDGGDATVALAFFDRIQSSPAPIYITATGLVASAAVLILAAGDKRYMTRSSWVMVHESMPEATVGARVTSLEREAASSRRMENQWAALMARSTRIDSATWASLHQNETYLDASECLELGLVEEIV